MKSILNVSAIFMLMLAAGCQNDKDSSSKPAASSFACSVSRSGSLTLCTQYQDLSGSTLTTIQSECQLRSSEGYSWEAAACPGNSVGGGTCTFAPSAQRPATGTQYFYGNAFATGSTAQDMCVAQGGTFTK